MSLMQAAQIMVCYLIVQREVTGSMEMWNADRWRGGGTEGITVNSILDLLYACSGGYRRQELGSMGASKQIGASLKPLPVPCFFLHSLHVSRKKKLFLTHSSAVSILARHEDGLKVKLQLFVGQ